MPSSLILLLVTTAFCVVMLLVLSSLKAGEVGGVREWGQANGLAVLALLLFASRGVLPEPLTVEVAHGLFLLTVARMYTGFRRHLGLPVPDRRLLAGALLTLGAVAAFHYGVDSVLLRTVAASIFHGSVLFAIGAGIPVAADARLRYPALFAKTVALLLAGAHALRAVLYAVEATGALTSPELPSYNLFFMVIGTLGLPTLTLGAIMMANARVLFEAAWAADHDHLTGAASRRAFFACAEREHARALRMRAPLALLLFDVDHFKRINDTHGHAVGDAVLCEIVARTRDMVRGIDVCGRLGGEEFAVLLPDADAHSAGAVAERLRGVLDGVLDGALGLPPPGQPVRYTVSIGVAMLEEGESLDGLMMRADAALYEAKAGGRNAVALAAARQPVGQQVGQTQAMACRA